MNEYEDLLNSLKAIEDYCKEGTPFGCGNWNCSKGCKLEYENVPNPHVYRSFDLFFEYDHEKERWHWEIEGTGILKNSEDPIELIHTAARWAEGERTL